MCWGVVCIPSHVERMSRGLTEAIQPATVSFLCVPAGYTLKWLWNDFDLEYYKPQISLRTPEILVFIMSQFLADFHFRHSGCKAGRSCSPFLRIFSRSGEQCLMMSNWKYQHTDSPKSPCDFFFWYCMLRRIQIRHVLTESLKKKFNSVEEVLLNHTY